MLRRISLTILVIGGMLTVVAQDLKQTISGYIIDKVTLQPLAGAHVIVSRADTPFYAVTDEKGSFRISSVPVGRISLTATYVGYQPLFLSNLMLTTGKELVVTLEMEESVYAYEAVVVSASRQKIRPTNEMALISSRSFSVEETERYAGSRGDVARMASNYAGVAFANDQRNDIIIRGNSPAGLLWRLDEVNIPNPNHFAENGTTGGPVSMLNNNVLRNSDFYTGAFPAEFGNAFSGVFDLKTRNGNPSRNEYTIQSGFNGIEVGAEGPISTKEGSTFLAYYRYSFLDFMDKLGFSFGTAGVPKYQDVFIKTHLPTQKGVLQAFVLAGKSQIAMLSSRLDSNDMYLSEGQDIYNRSMLETLAISYTHFTDEKGYFKIILSSLFQNGGTDIDTLDQFNKNPFRVIEHNIDEYRVTANTYFLYKHSASLTSKIGIQVDQMGYHLNSRLFNGDSLKLLPYLDQSKSLFAGPQLWQGYYQNNWKPTDFLGITAGLQCMYFSLNHSSSIEPRIAMAFHYTPKTTLTIGYGLHARTQPLAVYYLGKYYPNIGYVETNKNLGFTKANHWVAGHDWNINEYFRFKTEVYYQLLFNVPVSPITRWYSILNSGAYWGIDATDSLVNEGKGKNYGIEFTLEQFLHHNFYFLVTTSWYRSFYRDYAKVWHHTVFDGGYIINLLAGYEYPLSPSWAISFDSKLSTAGGKRYTPIDLQRSIEAHETVFDENYIFEKQYIPFFKLDLKISFRQNKIHSSQEWQIYVENVTNHRNPLYEYYNSSRKKITRAYQLGIFPMVLWRLTF